MGRPLSDCRQAWSFYLQVARSAGVGGEPTGKWFGSQALFFLSCLISSLLYTNNPSGSLLSHVFSVCFSLIFLVFNNGDEPAVAWGTSEFLGVIKNVVIRLRVAVYIKGFLPA